MAADRLVAFTNQPGVAQAVTCRPSHVATPAWLGPRWKVVFVKLREGAQQHCVGSCLTLLEVFVMGGVLSSL